MKVDEFLALPRKDKLCGYKGCTQPLGPRFDGEHKHIAGVPVCEDCYYDALGEEIEKHPIGRRRPRGSSITD